MFRSSTYFAAAALGIMKLESPARTVVHKEEQRKAVEGWIHTKFLVLSLIKRKDAVFAASTFWFRNIRRINITVPRANDLISVTFAHPNKGEQLLRNLARLLLLIELQKQEGMLEMNEAETLLRFLEGAKRPMEVLCEAMNLVCCIYDDSSRDLEDLHGADVGEELAKSVDFLLCNNRYNLRPRIKSEITSHDVFGPIVMNDF